MKATFFKGVYVKQRESIKRCLVFITGPKKFTKNYKIREKTKFNVR